MVCSICNGSINYVHNARTCPLNPNRVSCGKKVKKPLDGLLGCQNIFKEPKTFYNTKKVRKPLEGLAGCLNIFKEPTPVRKNKGTTKCAMCGETGHNQRTCTAPCKPCADQTCRSACFGGLSQKQAYWLAEMLEAEPLCIFD